LIATFGDAHDVTQRYLSERHGESPRLSRWSSVVRSWLAPSSYFVGQRTDMR
jgi:hypothetical protein